jgi:hypothetical protein
MLRLRIPSALRAELRTLLIIDDYSILDNVHIRSARLEQGSTCDAMISARGFAPVLRGEVDGKANSAAYSFFVHPCDGNRPPISFRSSDRTARKRLDPLQGQAASSKF